MTSIDIALLNSTRQAVLGSRIVFFEVADWSSATSTSLHGKRPGDGDGAAGIPLPCMKKYGKAIEGMPPV